MVLIINETGNVRIT